MCVVRDVAQLVRPLDTRMTHDDLKVTGPIYKISYDNLTIMQKLQQTYDGHLIYKTSDKERKVFLSTIHSQNHKII